VESQRGGSGLRGPGETQLETDRRLIGQKITALKKQLAQVKKQRATRRKSRMEGRLKTFAIVGYTNAGKSSLFNRLTKADVLAKDQLFATLDTTARRLFLSHEAGVILTDTGGVRRALRPPGASRCSPAFCTSPYCATTASPACSPFICPANYPAAPWIRARSMKPLCAC